MITPVGSASAGSASVGSASIGYAAPVGSAPVGSASVGSASLGSATIGLASVAPPPFGFASVAPPPAPPLLAPTLLVLPTSPVSAVATSPPSELLPEAAPSPVERHLRCLRQRRRPPPFLTPPQAEPSPPPSSEPSTAGGDTDGRRWDSDIWAIYARRCVGQSLGYSRAAADCTDLDPEELIPSYSQPAGLCRLRLCRLSHCRLRLCRLSLSWLRPFGLVSSGSASSALRLLAPTL